MVQAGGQVPLPRLFSSAFRFRAESRVRLQKLVVLLVENCVQDFDGDFRAFRWFRPIVKWDSKVAAASTGMCWLCTCGTSFRSRQFHHSHLVNRGVSHAIESMHRYYVCRRAWFMRCDGDWCVAFSGFLLVCMMSWLVFSVPS